MNEDFEVSVYSQVRENIESEVGQGIKLTWRLGPVGTCGIDMIYEKDGKIYGAEIGIDPTLANRINLGFLKIQRELDKPNAP